MRARLWTAKPRLREPASALSLNLQMRLRLQDDLDGLLRCVLDRLIRVSAPPHLDGGQVAFGRRQPRPLGRFKCGHDFWRRAVSRWIDGCWSPRHRRVPFAVTDMIAGRIINIDQVRPFRRDRKDDEYAAVLIGERVYRVLLKELA
jgi:hypothetical protein